MLQDEVHYYTDRLQHIREQMIISWILLLLLSGTSSFLKWLADSKLVQNQQRYEIHTKRQIKRQRVWAELRDDDYDKDWCELWDYVCYVNLIKPWELNLDLISVMMYITFFDAIFKTSTVSLSKHACP